MIMMRVINFLLGCSHKRTTFPLTPRRRAGHPAVTKGTYVVCLDCGREFSYNWDAMQLGSPLTQPQKGLKQQCR